MVRGSARARPAVALKLGQAPACSVVSEAALQPRHVPLPAASDQLTKTRQVTFSGQVELCRVEGDE